MKVYILRITCVKQLFVHGTLIVGLGEIRPPTSAIIGDSMLIR